MGIIPSLATRGGMEIGPELGTKHLAPQLQLEVMAEEDLQLMPTVPRPSKPGPCAEYLQESSGSKKVQPEA